MQELEHQNRVTTGRAIDSLPLWMRQMLEDKVQRCLQADAEDQENLENTSTQEQLIYQKK